MGDVKIDVGSNSHTYLLPNQISTNPKFNVRPFCSENTEVEDHKIEELASSIEAVGQLDPVVITADRILIIGHRRRRAALLINERRSMRGESLLRLRCTIDSSGGDLRQKSIISNLHRKEISPMDMAYLCIQIRDEYNWKGPTGTPHVASYLHIDRTSVYNYERLLYAEKELQNRIHSGEISAQSAYDLMKLVSTPRERQEILDRARVIQQEERVDKALNDYQAHKKSLKQTNETLDRSETRIERPSIIKAIREHHDRSKPAVNSRDNKAHPKPAAPPAMRLTQSELVKAIEELETNNTPPAARAFIRYFVYTFAKGKGCQSELRNKFLAIHDGRRHPKSALAS